MFISQKEKKKREEQEAFLQEELRIEKQERKELLDRYEDLTNQIDQAAPKIREQFRTLQQKREEQDKELTKVVDAIKEAQAIQQEVEAQARQVQEALQHQTGSFVSNEQQEESEMQDLSSILEGQQKIGRIFQEEQLGLESQEKKLQDLEMSIKKMDVYADSMSVTALNAAIEAGKLGATGRDLLLAVEQVRQLTGECQKMAEEIKVRIQDLAQDKQEKALVFQNIAKELNGLQEQVKNCKDKEDIQREKQQREAARKQQEEGSRKKGIMQLQDRMDEVCRQSQRASESYEEAIRQMECAGETFCEQGTAIKEIEQLWKDVDKKLEEPFTGNIDAEV